MCWKSTDATASDDYYDRLLISVMMEAAAQPNDDTKVDCANTDSIDSSCISSSSNGNGDGTDVGSVHDGDSSNGSSGHMMDVDASVAVSDDSDKLVQLKSHKSPTTSSVTATKAATGAPTGKTPVAGSTSTASQHIHLWQFLKELLTATEQLQISADNNVAHGAASPRSPSPSTASTASVTVNSACANKQQQQQQQMIRWLDRKQGVFKIEDSQAVARLWGRRKNRPAMNYDKLSRSLRQYYKKGIMQKTERSQRLVYQFCHPYNA